MDEEVVARDLVPAFIKLLKDNEAEVKSAIAGQIPGMLSDQVNIYDIDMRQDSAS